MSTGRPAPGESRGEREYEALIGAPAEESLEEVRLQSPQLYEALVEGAFGGPLARAELSRGVQEVATIATLAAAGGSERQLATHARAAIRNGVGASELRALCEHVAVYAGFPRALSGLSVIDQVLGEAGIPRPPQMLRVEASDHATLVAQRGDRGPAVVLVHALGLDWRMWEPVMARLSEGRRLFAYDIRSHGSAAGSPIPFNMDDTARDLFGVLDALEVESAHVVGLSFGGGIAQTAALHHPERIESLALVATTDYPFDAFEERARSGESAGMEAQVVPSLTRWFTPRALALNGWGVRYAREQIRRGQPTDWAASWRAFEGLDAKGRLRESEFPILVLAGEFDVSTTPEIMHGMAERMPTATYRELADTPHMQTLERPKSIGGALDNFLPSTT